MLLNSAIWTAYIALFVFLARKGQGHDIARSGKVSFVVQAFAYVATYISAVALVGFGGLAHAYGLQIMLVAIGNVVLGTWVVYKFFSWPTRQWQKRLGARTPTALLALGHNSPALKNFLALVFLVFLGVYASAVLKGAGLLFLELLPIPLWAIIWGLALLVGVSVYIGGFRGVLYTEAMQGVVMFLGMALLIGAVISKVGGPVEGIRSLAALAPTAKATNGFAALSGGGQGLFVLSLVFVTSVAVWAQPQMIQRHFAVSSPQQAGRTAPLAMAVLTIMVGGTYFAASLSRLFLPEQASPDAVMPKLVHMLLPEFGLHLFVLAIVSASISTATALFHIAASAFSEDLSGGKMGKAGWLMGIALCVVISASCAQLEGQFIALLCTTSWSMVGATALVPYIALVRFNVQNGPAALASAISGFTSCLGWYLLAYKPTALVSPIFGADWAAMPPFFVGMVFSLAGFGLTLALAGKKEDALVEEA
ncbi:sodium:solute symporter family protein [Desulfovibrio cuneatus]|uniref:sodium:solute symporter family protein n=1 Tax=Desulfovibrio cuneatus TaxID=159728 RepID=UPI0004128C19|nr:transporter [Desulfovibrio cuneatus]